MKWTNMIEKIFKNKKGQNQCVNDLTDEITQVATPLDIPFNISLLIIADTHGCLDENSIPINGYDLCVTLGDVFINDLTIINEKVKTPIYGLLGNHDGFELLNSKGINDIHNQIVEINGIKITGMQGSIKYKYSDMPLYTDDESIDIASQLPHADIFLSHDSPKHIFSTTDFAHSGLQGITKYCEMHNVPLHLHGHHHEEKTTILHNGTTSICCYGVCKITINKNQIEIERYT